MPDRAPRTSSSMLRRVGALLAGLSVLAACGDDATTSDVTTDTGATVPDVLADAADSATDTTNGSDLLAGDPGAPAIAALPVLAIPEPEADEVVDVDVMSIVRDRLVLALTDAATIGEVNALGRTLDARLVGTIPELGILVLGPRQPTEDLAWVAASSSANNNPRSGPPIVCGGPSRCPTADHRSSRRADPPAPACPPSRRAARASARVAVGWYVHKNAAAPSVQASSPPPVSSPHEAPWLMATRV